MHKICTIEGGKVQFGAKIQQYLGDGFSFPALIVGEQGRGRRLGILPVELPTGWGDPDNKVYVGTLGTTRSSRPKLIVPADETATDDSAVIVVLRTPIGYRGSNEHTGDRIPGCGEKAEELQFLPFPGTVLVSGRIAEGAAGYMGSGDQMIALIPQNAVFRTAYRGRLYGKPPAHYYTWTGEQLLSATWEERQLTDLF